MATRCLLGKRKNRSSKNHSEYLLDPEYDRSHASTKSRGKKLIKSIASMFGFGRKKKGGELERIGYEELEKNEIDMPLQWVRFEEKSEEKLGDLMDNLEEGKKKRPRLEELLGWNLKLSEKDEI